MIFILVCEYIINPKKSSDNKKFKCRNDIYDKK
jgi:hypothetical protein